MDEYFIYVSSHLFCAQHVLAQRILHPTDHWLCFQLIICCMLRYPRKTNDDWSIKQNGNIQ